jgi:hypothetical protein
MVRSFIADNIDINKSTVSKETTINFFQLLNWGNWILLIIPIYAKVSWHLYSVCIGSFMHFFTRVKKINDTYDILPFLFAFRHSSGYFKIYEKLRNSQIAGKSFFI